MIPLKTPNLWAYCDAANSPSAETAGSQKSKEGSAKAKRDVWETAVFFGKGFWEEWTKNLAQRDRNRNNLFYPGLDPSVKLPGNLKIVKAFGEDDVPFARLHRILGLKERGILVEPGAYRFVYISGGGGGLKSSLLSIGASRYNRHIMFAWPSGKVTEIQNFDLVSWIYLCWRYSTLGDNILWQNPREHMPEHFPDADPIPEAPGVPFNYVTIHGVKSQATLQLFNDERFDPFLLKEPQRRGMRAVFLGRHGLNVESGDIRAPGKSDAWLALLSTDEVSAVGMVLNRYPRGLGHGLINSISFTTYREEDGTEKAEVFLEIRTDESEPDWDNSVIDDINDLHNPHIDSFRIEAFPSIEPRHHPLYDEYKGMGPNPSIYGPLDTASPSYHTIIADLPLKIDHNPGYVIIRSVFLVSVREQHLVVLDVSVQSEGRGELSTSQEEQAFLQKIVQDQIGNSILAAWVKIAGFELLHRVTFLHLQPSALDLVRELDRSGKAPSGSTTAFAIHHPDFESIVLSTGSTSEGEAIDRIFASHGAVFQVSTIEFGTVQDTPYILFEIRPFTDRGIDFITSIEEDVLRQEEVALRRDPVPDSMSLAGRMPRRPFIEAPFSLGMAFSAGVVVYVRSRIYGTTVISKEELTNQQRQFLPRRMEYIQQRFKFEADPRYYGLSNPAITYMEMLDTEAFKQYRPWRNVDFLAWVDLDLHNPTVSDDYLNGNVKNHFAATVTAKIPPGEICHFALSPRLGHLSVRRISEFCAKQLGDIILGLWQTYAKDAELQYITISSLSKQSTKILRQLYDDPSIKDRNTGIVFLLYDFLTPTANMPSARALRINNRVGLIVLGLPEVRTIVQMLFRFFHALGQRAIRAAALRWGQRRGEIIPEIFIILDLSEQVNAPMVPLVINDGRVISSPVFGDPLASGMQLDLLLRYKALRDHVDLPLTTLRAEHTMAYGCTPLEFENPDDRQSCTFIFQGKAAKIEYDISTFRHEKLIMLNSFEDALGHQGTGQPAFERIVRLGQVYYESWRTFDKHLSDAIESGGAAAEPPLKLFKVEISTLCPETEYTINQLWAFILEFRALRPIAHLTKPLNRFEILDPNPIHFKVYFNNAYYFSTPHNFAETNALANEVFTILLGTVEIGGVAMMLNNYPNTMEGIRIEHIIVYQTKRFEPLKIFLQLKKERR
ncbi:hypothetical protein TWF730_010442 [Orbilia blumenaviensis]|uniref:Uncharacterized protein n=1 Tax=Orbilia blumenaviensis TaxID=1796055 RepID=A0AAV9UNN8_9PEZI